MKNRATFVRFGATLVLLAYLATRLDWRALGAIFANAEIPLIVLVVLLSPGLVLALAGRLYFLLSVQALPVSFVETWRATWAGQFFNTCLPGSTGGDLVRIFELIRLCQHQQARITGLVIVDRLFALFGLVLMATVAVVLGGFPWASMVPDNVELRVWLPVALGGVLGVLALAWICRNQLVLRWPWIARATRFMRQMWAETSVCVTRPRVAAIGLALALLVHIANFSLVYLLARSLGLGLGYGQTLALMPVLLLVLILPVTINGHGLRELILVGYFQWLHGAGAGSAAGPREQAVALSIVFVANDLVCSLPGGLWYLLNRRGSSILLSAGPTSNNFIK